MAEGYQAGMGAVPAPGAPPADKQEALEREALAIADEMLAEGQEDEIVERYK